MLAIPYRPSAIGVAATWASFLSAILVYNCTCVVKDGDLSRSVQLLAVEIGVTGIKGKVYSDCLASLVIREVKQKP